MSSGRFPPPANDPRFPRDRSPPKGPERRQQNNFGDNPLSTRGAEPGSRSNEPLNARREPPRGPKALVDGPRGGYVPRPRGGYIGRGDGRGRGDIRDREFRDGRDDAPFPRRGRGQDWSSRDRFDDRPRISPPVGRDRSRSPIREYKESRDGPSSAGSSVLDLPSRGRGGFRGRARGNHDFSERSRSSNTDEQEIHRARSRSRERDWERLVKGDRGPDGYRRDDKDDRSRREEPPGRPDSRNSGGAPRTPVTSRSTSTTSVQPANFDRLPQGYRETRESAAEYERRLLGQDGAASGSGAYKDLEKTSAPLKRTESDRYDSRNSSPPPQAPPVPAFGSIPPRALPPSQKAVARPQSSQDDIPAVHHSRLSLLDSSREIPSAPKAHILSNAPTAPKGRQSLDRDSGDHIRTQSAGLDKPRRLENVQNTDSPYGQPSALNTEMSTSRSESTQPSVRKAVEEQGRNGSLSNNAVPRAPSGDATSLLSSRIPTGPRADRVGAPNRPPVQPSIRGPTARAPPINPRGGGRQPNTLTWTNPNLSRAAPRGPSIMNTVPTKKDYTMEDRHRRSLTELDSFEPHPDPRISPQQRSFTSSASYRREHPVTSDPRPLQTPPESGATIDDHTEREVPNAVPDAVGGEEETDEDGLDDPEMDFDERDFQEAEMKFEREMQALEARRPPTPRSNSSLLILLEELDALASALEVKIKDGSADETIKVESAALGLPSPKADGDGESSNFNHDASSALALRQRPPTPPIDSLPFLASGPLTPTSFMEGLEEDPGEYEKIKDMLEERLALEEADLDSEYDELRHMFKTGYKAWRMEVEDREDAKRAQRVVETSPPPEAGPLTAQSTPAAGRRGRAHATELDIQKILKESEDMAAREEQRRREREDRVYVPPETFNDQREALVPEMLNRFEAEASIFPDNNNFVPPEQALTAFAFLPKPDDFTKEEHEAFVMEYVQNPKRFGTIARSEKLARRTYQDCVQHYYSTKLRCSYKTLEANFWKSARGKKVARRRGATNALGFGNDGQVDENQVLPLTDAGRPRRAAAPNFGATDTTDTEQPPAAGTPARRGQAGIMNAEKTSAKRPKTTGQKPGRKPKAQLLAPQPGPSPAPSPKKNDAPAFRIEPQSIPPEPFKRLDPDLEGAQALAGLNGEQFPVASVRGGDTWAHPVMPPVAQNRATPEQFHQEPPLEITVTHPGAELVVPINSYWNVAETQDLKNYLAYYGQDWQAIAVNIPAKTHTMVKNRFNKLVKEGDTSLEQIAAHADEKIKRGESMGAKPAPTPVSTKRRYDMTSRSDPRPLAPLSENAELDRSSPSLRPKTSIQPVPRIGHVPPTLATLAQAEQGAAALSSQMLSQGPANPANRVDLQPRSQPTQQLQGPRLGMFQESRPRPSSNAAVSLDTPPERPPPPPHRGLQPQNQQMAEKQKQLDMEAQLRQNDEAHYSALQRRMIKQERGVSLLKTPPHERERQTRLHETSVFDPSIQLDEASREVIMRQEQRKQHEREQREQQEMEQHLQQQHRQQQQAPQPHRHQPGAMEYSGTSRPFPLSFVESHYQHAASRSPASSNLQMPMSPPPHTRPSSVPAPTSVQPPAAPPQPKKKSNIMNLLNDDSEDTQSTRKVLDTRPVATPPPQHRQQPPQYQPEQSIDQMLHRRDAPTDSLQHSQPHHRNQHSQPQPQQPPMSREALRDWPSTSLHRQSMYEQLPSFHSPPAPSHPQPPSFIPSTAGHSFQSVVQRDRASSPLPSHHSRTSSYTSQHKHRSSVPSAPIEQSLRPSPYANLNPNPPPSSQQHHNAPHHQHPHAQQQQQQDALLQQQQHAQQRQRQQQEPLRLREPQELPRLHHQQPPPPPPPQQALQGLSEYRPRSTVNEDFQARATAARHEQERAIMTQDTFRRRLDEQLESRRAHERAHKEHEAHSAAARHHQHQHQHQQHPPHQHQNYALRRQQDDEREQQHMRRQQQQERDDLRAREDIGGGGGGGIGRYTPFYDQQGSGYAAPPPPPSSQQRDNGNPLPPPPPMPSTKQQQQQQQPPPSSSAGGVQGRGLGGGYEERR